MGSNPIGPAIFFILSLIVLFKKYYSLDLHLPCMIGGELWRGVRIKIVLATVFLGPSMMIALQMSGKSFQHYYDLGTDYGLSLMIVAVLVLVFKLALVDGLARYTLYRKDSVFSSLPDIPGPSNWAVWAVVTVYTLELAIYSSLALKAGASLTELSSWSIPVEVLALAIVSVILVFLLLRSRSIMEKVVYSIIAVVTVPAALLRRGLPVGFRWFGTSESLRRAAGRRRVSRRERLRSFPTSLFNMAER